MMACRRRAELSWSYPEDFSMNRLYVLALGHLAAGLVAAAPGPETERFVALNVRPAATPVPALRYQLLPEVSELNPGNAATGYLKCFVERPVNLFTKEAAEERERILSGPLTDVKPGALRDYGGHALRQADDAARLEYCDWNVLPRVRAEGYLLVLPEVQSLRDLASALAVRCRRQIADKDYEGAVHTLKTIFALARHMGDLPSIITGQVGAAIAQLGLNQIEDLIQQPDAPNLYWALTGLPAPLVEIRKSVSSNRAITATIFGPLLDRNRIWNSEDISAMMQKMKATGAMSEASEDDRKQFEAWFQARLKDEAWLDDARKGLVESRYPRDLVGKYPPEQVLLYHLYRKSRVNYDEAFKWIPVPYWQSAGPLAALQKAPTDVEEKLTQMMPFAVAKIKASHVRLEQQLALLRAVEAVRLEAAQNGGKAPANLSDLNVPVPVDPVTGKPFEYQADGSTATLAGKSIPISGGGTIRYRYAVRLRK
jgi:hypothetical protein